MLALDRYARMGEEILTILATLFLNVLEYKEGLIFGTLGVNLFVIPFLKELLSLSMTIVS